jgi:hypothetical protein
MWATRWTVRSSKGRYCIYLEEFLDNPAKLAYEQEFEGWCREAHPVGVMLGSLKRHFEEHKEGTTRSG